MFGSENLEIPPHYICPITHEIMRDPVFTADGHTYERQAIEEWFRRGHSTSPLTNNALPHRILTPCISLKDMITEFLSENVFLKANQNNYNDLFQAVTLREEFWAEAIQKEKLKSTENFKSREPYFLNGVAATIVGGIFSEAKKKLVPYKNSADILTRKYHSWFPNKEYESYLKKELTEIIDAYLRQKKIFDEHSNVSIVEELIKIITPSMLDMFYSDYWETKIGQFSLNPFGQKTGCIKVYEEKILSKDYIFNKLDSIFKEKNEDKEEGLSVKLGGMAI
jgi:U-box domain